jgi:UDPglucose 6-dehydrogenase
MLPSKLPLSVIGLGKLGSPLAVIFAAKGFPTLGLDINKKYVDAINHGRAPVVEPFLQEYLDKGKQNIRATQNYREIIDESDFTFLIVPTPSGSDHHFSDEYLKQALKELASALKESRKSFHNFVIVSTVSPGTIEKSLIPWIQEHSGRTVNEGFAIAYNPEFIALGDVINGLLKPDIVLIGESNKEIGDQLEKLYLEYICENKPYMARMSIISAEIAKISLNAFITMKISYANTLANICEKIPGADIDAITKAIGADKRVSPHYLKGGMPFGGACFPRDSRAFAAFAKEYGVDAKLARATDEINELQVPLLKQKIIEHLPEEKTVAVLGLAFKPDTPVIEESPSIKLIELLLRKGIQVVAYDPLAMEATKEIFGDKIIYAVSPQDALRKSSCAVIATRHKEFQELGEEHIIHNPTIIIDCWRNLGHLKNSPKVRYVGLGLHLSS